MNGWVVIFGLLLLAGGWGNLKRGRGGRVSRNGCGAVLLGLVFLIAGLSSSKHDPEPSPDHATIPPSGDSRSPSPIPATVAHASPAPTPTLSLPPLASPTAVVALPMPSAPTPQLITATEAQRIAIQPYPDLGISGSKLNLEFVARYKRYQHERPDFLSDPSWPLRLAEEISTRNTPSPKPIAERPTQAEANAFIGLTEKQLIQRLGRPISVTSHSSPDGPFKMLEWDRTKGSETFFSIFADDGRVNYGYYRGVPTKGT